MVAAIVSHVRWARWLPAPEPLVDARHRVRGSFANVASSPATHTLALATESGRRLMLHDYLTGQSQAVGLSEPIGRPFDFMAGVAMSRDGALAATTCVTGGVSIVDTALGQEVHFFKRAKASYSPGSPRCDGSIAFDSTGRYVSLESRTAALDMSSGQVWSVKSVDGADSNERGRLESPVAVWEDAHSNAIVSRGGGVPTVEWAAGNASHGPMGAASRWETLSEAVARVAEHSGYPPFERWVGADGRLVAETFGRLDDEGGRTYVFDLKTGHAWRLADVVWTAFLCLDEERGLVILIDHAGLSWGVVAGTRVWVVQLPGFQPSRADA